MIPVESGYYWIKVIWTSDGGVSLSEWRLAEFRAGMWFETGDEMGILENRVAVIGPKVEPPNG